MFGTDRGGADSEVFPDHIEASGTRWRLEYRHEPGELGDGVAVNIALAALGDLSADRLEWGVPGMLSERLEAMIRSLPKRLRTRFSPVRETVSALVESVPFGEGCLADVLARRLTSIAGVQVDSSDFDTDRLADHLRMLLIVRDDDGQEVDRDRSLEALRLRLSTRVEAAFHDRVDAALEGLIESPSSEIPQSELPEHIVVEGAAGGVRAWLAMSRREGLIEVTGPARREQALRGHRAFLLEELKTLGGRAFSGHLDWLLEGRGDRPEFRLLGSDRSFRSVVEDLTLDAAFFVPVDGEMAHSPWDLRSRSSVQACFEAGFSDLSRRAENVVDRLEDSMRLHADLALHLDKAFPRSWLEEIEAMKRELADFLPRAVDRCSWFELDRTPRHLRALDFRLKRIQDKGPAAERRDHEVLIGWRQRLEQARPLLAGHERFEAFEFALQERRTHLAVPGLALEGAGAKRLLVTRWNELCAVSAGRLIPVSG